MLFSLCMCRYQQIQVHLGVVVVKVRPMLNIFSIESLKRGNLANHYICLFDNKDLQQYFGGSKGAFEIISAFCDSVSCLSIASCEHELFGFPLLIHCNICIYTTIWVALFTYAISFSMTIRPYMSLTTLIVQAKCHNCLSRNGWMQLALLSFYGCCLCCDKTTEVK